MKMKRFVGIDPGKQGGVSWVDVSNKGVERNAISFKDMTPRDLFETLSDVMDDVDDCTVVIEKVGTMPKDSASNAFKFGYSAGMLEAAAVAASKPYHFVVPAKWQGFMKCRTKGDKSVTRKMAQQLFPGFHLRITNQIADAMLLCEYCRKVHGETLSEPEAPKKRGRKPKGEMVVLSEKVGAEKTESFLPDEQPKKRRGRPRKVASVDKAVPSGGQTESTSKKRRKRKGK
jgi:Holliday junction resolvasome RuvABC endonuclease subunit